MQFSEKLTDPLSFEGLRSDKDSFLIKLLLKLNSNADRFPSKASKVFYAVSRLIDKAEKAMQLRINRVTGIIEFQTLQEFSNWIISEFEDSDKMRNAQVELQALKQKNRDFSIFYSEFASLMINTGFNDEGKTATLLNGISKELRAVMTVRNILPTFPELVKDLHKVDGRLRTNEAFNRSASATSSNARNLNRPQQQQQQRPQSNNPRPAVVPSVTLALPPAEPMNTSAGAGRGPLTPAERERRIRGNLCTYCGGNGHYRKNCPNKPAPRLQVIEWHDTLVIETPSNASETGN